MEAGLIACGAKVQATADGMIIEGQPDGSFNSCVIESLGDHRIAMAFAVAGQRSAQHITILDTNNVATSFPGFVELARSCGMQLRQQS
jgi:3-phosphoshikimate 1-carboxyvinyltransferase